jgi:hypothetical protein
MSFRSVFIAVVIAFGLIVAGCPTLAVFKGGIRRMNRFGDLQFELCSIGASKNL